MILSAWATDRFDSDFLGLFLPQQTNAQIKKDTHSHGLKLNPNLYKCADHGEIVRVAFLFDIKNGRS